MPMAGCSQVVDFNLFYESILILYGDVVINIIQSMVFIILIPGYNTIFANFLTNTVFIDTEFNQYY